MSSAMSVVTGVAVHPNSGDPVAIGIESFNEIRFEPVLEGVFAEVRWARWGSEDTIVNLNPHAEGVHSLPPAERAKSVGDPRLPSHQPVKRPGLHPKGPTTFWWWTSWDKNW